MQIKSILAGLAVLSLATAANADTITFDGSTDNTWNTAANWDLDRVPADGDHVVIPDGKTCNVDITTARADSFAVSSGGVLIIDAGKQLEIDSASSVADMQGIQLAGSASALKASGSLTISGAGSIEGKDNAAELLIKGNAVLTSTAIVEGKLTIKGEHPFVGNNGAYINNGVVDANAAGTLLVHADTVLGAGTGDWKVTTSGSAVLEFDSGSACGTEVGELFMDDGRMQVDADVTFNDFEWDYGDIFGTDTKKMRYDSFNAGSSQNNPSDGTEECTDTYDYVDTYAKYAATIYHTAGNWSTSANWSNGIPDLDDSVVIDAAVTVDTATAQAGAIQVNADVTINGSNKLEIDGGFMDSEGNEVVSDSTIASTKRIILTGSSAPVLEFSGTTTVLGAGSIEGQHDDVRIDIVADMTLTLSSSSTIDGQMEIKGLTGGTTNGSFQNNGVVEANAAGKLLVHSQTVLAAGTGEFRVNFASAVFEFDTGTSCGTEVGDLVMDAGILFIDAAVVFDNFHWDGGDIDTNLGTPERMIYDFFTTTDESQTDPDEGDDCDGNSHDYIVNNYPYIAI